MTRPSQHPAKGQALKGAEVQHRAAENRAALQHGTGKHLPKKPRSREAGREKVWSPGLSKLEALGIPKSPTYHYPYP